MKTGSLHVSSCVVGALFVATWAGPLAAQAPAPSGTVITIAGSGLPGYSGDGGPATAAMLHEPNGVGIGPDGSIYFPDAVNLRIRKIDLATLDISTVAGDGTLADPAGDSGDGGPATSAQLAGTVVNVTIDPARNALYFSDIVNNKVRKVDLATGTITRYAGTGIFGFGSGGDGGPATSAELALPQGVGTDGAGKLSIADSNNDRVRQVDPVTGIITTIADNSDSIFGPIRVSADAVGNVFVLNQDLSGNSIVHRVDAVTGMVTLVAGGGANNPNSGSGPATSMDLDVATDLAEHDGRLFIAAGSNNQVWQVDLASGELSVYAGTGTAGFSGDGGPAINAEFQNMGGVTVTPAGEVIVSDTANHRIRYIVPESINLVGSDQTVVRFQWISSLSGDVNISNNDGATGIDLGSLTMVAGFVNVGNNDGATEIDLSSIAVVDGTVSVGNNDGATVVDLGLLTTAGGDVAVTDNGSMTSVVLSSLTSVGGDLTIETAGSGTFDVDGADVEGDTSLSTTGYTEVDAATAAGETALTMINGEATMELVLPDGAYPVGDPVTFSVEQLGGDPVETWGESAITTLAEYQFNFEIATLGMEATLNFEIDLAAMDAAARMALLDLLDMEQLLTLAVLGDDPGAELQLFDVCGPGEDPTAGGCVAVSWLDENGAMLEPYGGIDPSVLRFEALVGHFSNYSIVAVIPEPASAVLLGVVAFSVVFMLRVKRV